MDTEEDALVSPSMCGFHADECAECLKTHEQDQYEEYIQSALAA